MKKFLTLFPLLFLSLTACAVEFGEVRNREEIPYLSQLGQEKYTELIATNSISYSIGPESYLVSMEGDVTLYLGSYVPIAILPPDTSFKTRIIFVQDTNGSHTVTWAGEDVIWETGRSAYISEPSNSVDTVELTWLSDSSTNLTVYGRYVEGISWDLSEEGLLVEDIPQGADNYMAKWEVPSTFGSALGTWHLEEDVVNAVNTLDIPNAVKSGGYTTGYIQNYALGGTVSGYLHTFPQSTWPVINETSYLNIEFWHQTTESTTDTIFSVFDNGSTEFTIERNSEFQLRLEYPGGYINHNYTFTPGSWYHISINYDPSGEYRFYINGALQASDTFVPSSFTFSYGGTDDYMYFSADEVTFVDEVIVREGSGSLRTSNFTPSTSPLGVNPPPPKLEASVLTETNLVEAVALAGSAIQPEDLGTAAYVSTNNFAPSSITNDIVYRDTLDDLYMPRDGSLPATGDQDYGGYDIGVVGDIQMDGIIEILDNTFIGGKVALNNAGTFSRPLAAETNVLYVGGIANQARWSVGNWIVPLSGTLATNHYKITSIDQCASNGVPLSTLTVGDYYMTAEYSGAAVVEESATIAKGLTMVRLVNQTIFQGWTLDYSIGAGYGGNGMFGNLGCGFIRPGLSAGSSFLTEHANRLTNLILAPSSSGPPYTMDIIAYCTQQTATFNWSIDFRATYSGATGSTTCVEVLPDN